MALAWKAGWVNSPRGFESRILRHVDEGAGTPRVRLPRRSAPALVTLSAAPVAREARHDPSTRLLRVIFKRVGDQRPYPDHGLSTRAWADVPPRQVRLDQLVTTRGTLDLATLLDEDSTFYGDLFAHVVEWQGELYLETGLHRALRAALQQRNVLHARVHKVEA
jgi:Arc/MetJ family transcription regulator